MAEINEETSEQENKTETKLTIDDFPGLKAIKEELLKRGWKKVEK